MKRILLPLLGALALAMVGLYLVEGASVFRAGTYRLPSAGLPLALTITGSAAAYWFVAALRLQLLGAVQGHGLPLATGVLVHLAGLFSAAVTPGVRAARPRSPLASVEPASPWAQPSAWPSRSPCSTCSSSPGPCPSASPTCS